MIASTLIPQPRVAAPAQAISLSEVISAMTFALDMTEGAVPGHGLRSCLLGMRIAKEMGLSREMQTSLYYALQLKDVGCSSNASRMTQILGGDDREINAAIKLENWRSSGMSWRGMKTMWRNTLPGKPVHERVRRFFTNSREAAGNRKAMSWMRCERGAAIVSQLDMDERTVEAVRHVDEHWDGQGFPDGLGRARIPVLSRICSIAQNLDVFATEFGVAAAMAMLLKREGTWFDPEVVTAVARLHAGGEFWRDCEQADVEETRAAVRALDPGEDAALSPEYLDRICTAFASVVDAKSPFTYRHSLAVTEVAVRVAEEMGLSEERVQLVRRAALLHDLGKLSVPNTILDKESDLTEEEWVVVKAHPEKTRSILERIAAFSEVAVIAGEHHEKLDGSGYPLGLKGEEMCTESRILVIADIFTAMAEGRSYNPAHTPKEIVQALRKSVPSKLDPECYQALCVVASGWSSLADVTPHFEEEEVKEFWKIVRESQMVGAEEVVR